MKTIMNVLLVIVAFAWITGVSADKGSRKQSPESILTCVSVDIYLVASTALPSSINTDACAVESPCGHCIESLESQGCKIIDHKLDHLLRDIGGDEDWPQAFASYFLSCKKP
jgi:hypothetical protein